MAAEMQHKERQPIVVTRERVLAPPDRFIPVGKQYRIYGSGCSGCRHVLEGQCRRRRRLPAFLPLRLFAACLAGLNALLRLRCCPGARCSM